MKFMPFEVWIERNPDMATDDDCPACDGSGWHKCSCGDMHDCPKCEGTGHVSNITARELYQAECARERAALEQFTTR